MTTTITVVPAAGNPARAVVYDDPIGTVIFAGSPATGAIWQGPSVGNNTVVGTIRQSAGDPDVNGVNTTLTATGFLVFDPSWANQSQPENLGQDITITMNWGAGVYEVIVSKGTYVPVQYYDGDLGDYTTVGSPTGHYTTSGGGPVHFAVTFTQNPYVSATSGQLLECLDQSLEDFYRLCPGAGPFTVTATYQGPVVVQTPIIRGRPGGRRVYFS